jgi:hypothetical protein
VPCEERANKESLFDQVLQADRSVKILHQMEVFVVL